ncbi:leader peptidase (prepilin peptidase)/N-methyltransferase [Paenibacillus pabuli]|uniref:Leader peptidase (Prepilin peptidase)/N-methyltransferase n=1 Tax=Paenibacillus pabuli TaxID=1472 RepID=A0ABX9BEU3_9BACL|nr:prepilin peptidase [Paenibacillus pabuli]RAI89596.1 leader peptidase (prepilin peptidase)/N-methyltransferase [Paenibacillus pabuli]
MELLWIDLPLYVILIWATYTDIKSRVIPDKLVVSGLCYFLVLRIGYADQPYFHYLLGVIAGAGILYVCALIRPGSFGGGDIKLLAVVGVALGWRESLLFLCLLLGIAGLYAVTVFLIWKDRKSLIPLSPFFLAVFIFHFFINILMRT